MGKSIEGYNVSEKYRSIWIAPERTGSRKVAEIFFFYDFKCDDKLVFQFGDYHFSHTTNNDNKFDDYLLICNLRNPYSKVLSLFKNFYDKESVKTKETFKRYLLEDLPSGQMKKMVLNPILSRVPDHVIRLEYMREDLMKLPFILDVLTEKQVDLFTQHGKEIEEWESFYDQESKDIVYEYCKDQFIFGNYSK
jgi:hypothetical protein